MHPTVLISISTHMEYLWLLHPEDNGCAVDKTYYAIHTQMSGLLLALHLSAYIYSNLYYVSGGKDINFQTYIACGVLQIGWKYDAIIAQFLIYLAGVTANS